MTIVWRFTFNKIRLIKKSFMLIRCRYNLQCVFIICLILSPKLWAWRCLFLKRSHARKFFCLAMKIWIVFDEKFCELWNEIRLIVFEIVSFMFSRLCRVWALKSTALWDVCSFLHLLWSPLQTQQNGRAWTLWYLDTFVCWGCLFYMANFWLASQFVVIYRHRVLCKTY